MNLDKKRKSKQTVSVELLQKANISSANQSATNMSQTLKTQENLATANFLSNKVKTKDLYRSQVFPAKTSNAGTKPPTTLLVNKEVNREEAMAGLALLDKHEQAMKRYDA